MAQSYRDNAEEFLAARNLSITALEKLSPTIAPEETLILVGSVPEGLANANSDVDLLILGECQLQGGYLLQQEENDVTVHTTPAGVKIGFEAVRPGYLALLGERMGEMVRVLRAPSRAGKVHMFSEIDIRVLHRVRTGVVLQNAEIADEWRQKLHCDSLPGYLTLSEVGRHFSRREDALGEFRAQHPASALWMLRESVDYLAGAVLASLGETNPYLKWRVRLLERYRDRLGEALVAPLLRAMTCPSVTELGDYVRQTIDLCDNVLLAVCQNLPQITPVLQELHHRVAFATHVD